MANIKDKKTHTVGIRVNEYTYRALEKLAEREQRTVSNLLRIWLEKSLSKMAKSKKAINGIP